jgi:hypothetical protein
MRSDTINGALSLVTLLSDQKFAETSTDQIINGSVVVNVASEGYYAIIFNPSDNTPFPSDTDSAPTRVFVKKLRN